MPKLSDKAFVLTTPALPLSVDLRTSGFMPAVYDQKDLGSCTANALAAAVQYDRAKQGEWAPDPSRLFIYWHERWIEGSPYTDSGAEIADGITTLLSKGVCPETIWPYDMSKVYESPTEAAFGAAWAFKALTAERTNGNLTKIKTAIAAGIPVVFGFTVYESFESEAVAQSGIVEMPGPNEQVVGGHAVVAVGYDDATQRVIVRNSWGVGWGQSGYFTMPYDYITNENLANDHWAVYSVK